MEKEILLDVKHLRTSFFMDDSEVKAVNDVSYQVRRGEIVAIVGESGSGKSVTQMTVNRLLQEPPGKILSGEVWLDGENLLTKTQREMQKIRGSKISMIFQEPMTSLNPVISVGSQLSEVIRKHKKVSKAEAWQLGIQALKDVDIPDPERRMRNYPFEMSGGMRQRVMIAVAVACNAELIIADEPTTALDVTTQAQVMRVLQNLVTKYNKSIILVTHNLGLVTRYADRIYVMYAGRIVEQGTTKQLLTDPRHPYTIGLLNCVPRIGGSKQTPLVPIKGAMPKLSALPEYCSFYTRCPYADEGCRCAGIPELREIDDTGRKIACHKTVTDRRD